MLRGNLGMEEMVLVESERINPREVDPPKAKNRRDDAIPTPRDTVEPTIFHLSDEAMSPIER